MIKGGREVVRTIFHDAPALSLACMPSNAHTNHGYDMASVVGMDDSDMTLLLVCVKTDFCWRSLH